MYELDALAFEYQRDYGTASKDLDISDFVNNPFVNCELRIFSLPLSKKFSDFSLGDLCVLGNDTPNPFLVTEKAT